MAFPGIQGGPIKVIIYVFGLRLVCVLLVFSLVVILISCDKTHSLAALTCFVSVAALILELHAVATVALMGEKGLQEMTLLSKRIRKTIHYVEIPSHEVAISTKRAVLNSRPSLLLQELPKK